MARHTVVSSRAVTQPASFLSLVQYLVQQPPVVGAFQAPFEWPLFGGGVSQNRCGQGAPTRRA